MGAHPEALMGAHPEALMGLPVIMGDAPRVAMQMTEERTRQAAGSESDPHAQSRRPRTGPSTWEPLRPRSLPSNL